MMVINRGYSIWVMGTSYVQLLVINLIAISLVACVASRSHVKVVPAGNGGCVSAATPEAVSAGIEILKAGGNALLLHVSHSTCQGRRSCLGTGKSGKFTNILNSFTSNSAVG